MMNQKNIIMVVSGVVAAVTSLVFTGSAMGLIGVKKSSNVTLDTTVAGNQPTPPAPVKADTKAKAEKAEQTQTIETNL